MGTTWTACATTQPSTGLRSAPDNGADLCSQPTISRLENTPRLRDVIRLGGMLVDLWCANYAKPTAWVTLGIDDTADIAHGHQQLSLFEADGARPGFRVMSRQIV